MKIFAQQGETRFLVVTDEKNALGRTVDLDEQVAHREHGVDSILSRGYWNKVTATPITQQRALKLVEGHS